MNVECNVYTIQHKMRSMQQDFTSRSKESCAKREFLRNFMDEKGLDALYMRNKDSFAWLSAGANNGGVLSTHIGAAGILITEKSQYVIASNIETPRLQEEEHLQELGFDIISTDWMRQSDYDKALMLASSNNIYSDIAIEQNTHVHNDFISLRYSLVDDEITRYKFLGILSSLILEQTMETLHPGMSELEIVAKLSKNLWSVGIEPINLLCAVDERIQKYRHPSPTERTLEHLCMVSLGARYSGLIVSLTRMASFGGLSDIVKEQKGVSDTVFEKMVMKTLIGNPVSEILGTGMLFYKQAGYPKEYEKHHQGGAIGYLPREYKVTLDSTQIVHTKSRILLESNSRWDKD